MANTNCQLANENNVQMQRDIVIPLMGNGHPPDVINVNQVTEFNWSGENGSVAAVVYADSKSKIKWITAWSNFSNKPNKAHTMILGANETIEGDTVKENLDKSSSQSSHSKSGYVAEIIITPFGDNPTMIAILKLAS